MCNEDIGVIVWFQKLNAISIGNFSSFMCSLINFTIGFNPHLPLYVLVLRLNSQITGYIVVI